jgi:hypothetical protein
MSLDPSSEIGCATSVSAGSLGPEDFDWVLRSPVELPPPERMRFATLASMLETDVFEQDHKPLLMGASSCYIVVRFTLHLLNTHGQTS